MFLVIDTDSNQIYRFKYLSEQEQQALIDCDWLIIEITSGQVGIALHAVSIDESLDAQPIKEGRLSQDNSIITVT